MESQIETICKDGIVVTIEYRNDIAIFTTDKHWTDIGTVYLPNAYRKTAKISVGSGGFNGDVSTAVQVKTMTLVWTLMGELAENPQLAFDKLGTLV